MSAAYLRSAAIRLRAEWDDPNPMGTAWHQERDLHFAVADWLDAVADIAPPDPHHEWERCETCEQVGKALAVADAVLGGDS